MECSNDPDRILSKFDHDALAPNPKPVGSRGDSMPTLTVSPPGIRKTFHCPPHAISVPN